LRFQLFGTPYYEYCQSTLAEGLKELGHEVYGWNGETTNYKDLYQGQDIDVFINAFPHPNKGEKIIKEGVPNIIIWPYDISDNLPFESAKYRFTAAFVRDLMVNLGKSVFPFNYGIENRYYCITDKINKPLAERPIDVIFTGEAVGKRVSYIRLLQEHFKSLNCMLDFRKYSGYPYQSKPNTYWCQWVNGRFCHYDDYYEALSESKIVLSLNGSGPECGRHYEAYASGGLPLIQKSGTIQIEPSIPTRFPNIVFDRPVELSDKISYYLGHLDEAQNLANQVFEFGRNNLRTIHRAQYVLDKLQEVISEAR